MVFEVTSQRHIDGNKAGLLAILELIFSTLDADNILNCDSVNKLDDLLFNIFHGLAEESLRVPTFVPASGCPSSTHLRDK